LCIREGEEVDPIYFESSYYVAAEDAGKRPYALLARAMRESATWRWRN